jgi:hypothetical protein
MLRRVDLGGGARPISWPIWLTWLVRVGAASSRPGRSALKLLCVKSPPDHEGRARARRRQGRSSVRVQVPWLGRLI